MRLSRIAPQPGHARIRIAALVFVALVAADLGLGGAVVAQEPGSIVYIREHNVWLMSPDGGQQRQLTTDGTAAVPYESPAQSDAGTIVAVRNEPVEPGTDPAKEGRIVVLDRAGGVVRTFVPDQPQMQDFQTSRAHTFGIINLDISPDGGTIVYEPYYLGDDCHGAFNPCFVGDPGYFLLYVGVDGTPISGPSALLESDPSFIDDQTVLGTSENKAWHLSRPGQQESVEWFSTDNLVEYGYSPAFDAAYSATSRRLATVIRAGSEDLGRHVALWLYADAVPPQPATPVCAIAREPHDGVSGDGHLVSNPTWSPDGDAIAWQRSDVHSELDDLPYYYGGDTRQLPANGIYVASVSDLAGLGCDAVGVPVLIAPDGIQPSWGPAGVDGGGGPPPPQPGGGDRVDGGGSTNPIGQAIAVSRSLFVDGQADRVLVATADRFPDALAGAALAGTRGPILFTPSGVPLDSRVEAEIARVTGGDGVVLTLGGVAAVTEQAATAARAAAGDRACTGPLPPSCRFAGTGREETAALIATTVWAENPQAPPIVMVARGDDFADAITGGAFAAATGIPILLTPTDLAHPFAVDWLRARSDVALLIVLGGTAAVSDATAAQLPAPDVMRVAGLERTATSAAIATQLWAEMAIGGGGVSLVNVRDPQGWQTALSAAVASAVHDRPQLGVEPPPAPLSPAVLDVLRSSPGPVVAFGDAALVSAEQLAEASATAGGR